MPRWFSADDKSSARAGIKCLQFAFAFALNDSRAAIVGQWDKIIDRFSPAVLWNVARSTHVVLRRGDEKKNVRKKAPKMEKITSLR